MKGETKELTRKQYDKELRDLQEELVPPSSFDKRQLSVIRAFIEAQRTLIQDGRTSDS